jgi:uncharacterized repeat protein (TIGR01451 family)
VPARLAEVAARIGALPAGADPSSLSDSLVHVDRQGRIQVVLGSSAVGPNVASDLAGIGAVGSSSASATPSAGAGLVQAWVPHDRLDAAASLPWARSMAPPSYSHVSASSGAGSTVTAGVDQLDAAALQAKGITGAGVTVGVVSDGVTTMSTAQASGDLPASVQLVGGAGSGDEGTAMLEIVHDMAPGASLAFAPAGDTPITFVNALQALATAKVNVIVHDVAFDTEPVFDEGFVAQSIDSLASEGVAVYAASGNVGIGHVRVPAVGTGNGPEGRSGPFAGCSKQPTNTVAIGPNGRTSFQVAPLGGPGFSTYVLQWSEPYADLAGHGAFTNLDLYLMDDSLTRCLGESVDLQANGVGDSLEAIAFQTATTVKARLVVNVTSTSSAVAPPNLDIRFRDAASLDPSDQSRSINPNNNFTSGLPSAVGAVDAKTGNVEPYSGAGPVTLGSTTICPGNATGACTGVAGPPVQTLIGPAFMGVDDISVTGAGGFPKVFQGTSAAAPHAAGCDALVRQAIGSPGAPVQTVRDRLAASAKDIAPSGVDSVSGAGLLDCAEAARISNLSVTATGSPPSAAVGDTLTYDITIANAGPDASKPFAFVDGLPPGATFASGPAGCTAPAAAAGASQLVTCPEDALASGASRSVTVTATLGGPLPDGVSTIVNRATVISPFDNTPSDNSVDVATAVGATQAGGPITREALARTGDNQWAKFRVALLLLLVGALLWLVGLDRWRPRRGGPDRVASSERL